MLKNGVYYGNFKENSFFFKYGIDILWSVWDMLHFRVIFHNGPHFLVYIVSLEITPREGYKIC